ncbi:MAG: bifunctional phosphoribosyl-AMP cyclohydrolase/phosphoribosyl-ATP diphosphatase HisIE [Acidobacteriota bacterium]|nr:bifunctional phosphoribosyl-AMP cyclohydrolase/phosphoribosyl-ATP diphosphatase HisIE [Acidobacteriota bacterium]
MRHSSHGSASQASQASQARPGASSKTSTQTAEHPSGTMAGTVRDPDSLTYDDRGLLPVVVQDAAGGAVLMVAWANREAVAKTLETGEAHFWSRSRRKLWRKGETSGNVLRVVEVLADCDRDTLLVRAHPAGPACHRGTRTCFEPNPVELELGWLRQVLEERRKASPEESYTARLLAKGLPRVAQKVGEEAVETVIAALGEGDDGGGNDEELVGEAADLLYHLSVLLLARGIPARAVTEELRRRHQGEGS